MSFTKIKVYKTDRRGPDGLWHVYCNGVKVAFQSHKSAIDFAVEHTKTCLFYCDRANR